MSTIDIGIAAPTVPIRAPGAITPKPSPAPVVATKPVAQGADDAFYIGSVKIETQPATHAGAAPRS